MREASSLVLAARLEGEGASVAAFDPVARRRRARSCRAWRWPAPRMEALEGADAAVLVTEWPEFAELDWAEVAKRMANPLLVDGRNFLDPGDSSVAPGIAYEAIGRPSAPDRLTGRVDAGTDPGRGRGDSPAAAHLHGREAGPAAGRPSAHRLRDRLARAPRRRRRDRLLRPPRRGDAERSRGRSRSASSLRFAEEPDARGTAGAIRFADDMLADRFFVLNGDVLCDLDLTAQIEQHERTGAAGHDRALPGRGPDGLRPRPPPATTARSPSSSRSPSPTRSTPTRSTPGAYLLERSVLDDIPPDRKVSIEREVFPKLIGNGLYGIRLEGYWIDIGTPDRFLEANWDILEGRVETVHGAFDEPKMVGEGCQIAEGAEIRTPSVIGSRLPHRRRRRDRALRSARPLRGRRTARWSRTASSAPA